MIDAGSAFGGGVVDANDFAIFGQTEVAFDAVRLLLPCEFESSQRIFRCIVRRTTMGDDQLGLAGVGHEK